MAGIFLVMNLFWAVRYNGFWGLIKHIFGVKMETNKWVFPLFLLLFIFIGADGPAFHFCSPGRWRWPCVFMETFLPVKPYWT